jgi:hypothetical protein
MSKKVLIGLVVVLALCLSQTTLVSAADSKTPAAKGEKTEIAKTPMHHKAANMVAVCGCGKVFSPTASTKYVEHNGKSYACCSDACHEAAMKDPAGTAKAVEDHIAKLEAAK